MLKLYLNWLNSYNIDLLATAVSACVPAQSSIDRGYCSLPSPSPSRSTSKLRHGAPGITTTHKHHFMFHRKTSCQTPNTDLNHLESSLDCRHYTVALKAMRQRTSQNCQRWLEMTNLYFVFHIRYNPFIAQQSTQSDTQGTPLRIYTETLMQLFYCYY